MQSNVLEVPESDVPILFGLHVDVVTQQKRLQAASVFTQIRKQVEQDRLKLKTFSVSDFKRSTKRKTFTNAIHNAFTDKTESELLLPLVENGDGLVVNVSPLDLLILFCFSLTAAHYKQIRENDLVALFPQLFRATIGSIEMDVTMRNMFGEQVRKVCQEKGNEYGERLLKALDGSFSQNILPGQTLEYSGLDIMTIQPFLGTSIFVPGIQKSRGWLWEREHESSESPIKLTNSIKARVQPILQEDIEFRIRVGWDDGWLIINSLGFQSYLPV